MKKSFAFEYVISIVMLLVLSLVSTIGVLTYKRFTNIITGVASDTRPDLRLVTAKTLLSDLTEAENDVKSFSLTEDTAYLNEYYYAIEKADRKLGELHALAEGDSIFSLLIDDLDTLVGQKFSILNELLFAQDEFRVQEALDKVVMKVGKAAVSDSVDSLKIGKDTRAGKLLGWLFKRKKEKEIEPETPKPKPETVVSLSDVNRQVAEVKVSEGNIEAALKAYELELINADSDINKKINSLVDELEAREMKQIENKALNAEENMLKTNRQIAIFCLVSGLLLLFMTLSIINYVRNNNRYRRALKAARKHALELAAMKERFLANMSHEIRTPLNAISGFVDQIAQSDLTPEQEEQIEIVRKSSEHLLYLINDVLDFSKLQAGKLGLETIGFDPREVIEDVMHIIEPLAGEKELVTKVNLDDQIPEVLLGDPFRLRQILLNVLSNAVKFTEQGEVIFNVSPVLLGSENLRLKLEITDTGVGIPQNKLNKLFTEFEQATVGTARLYGGTGLGLSITKRLVDLHEGVIQINSEEGVGTRLEIELNYAIGQPSDLQEHRSQQVSPDQLAGMKILIVDDEKFNRSLLSTILKKQGAIFTESANGQEALKEVIARDYDLVLMDARMPIMNGVDATIAIRSLNDSKKKAIPIIALTAAVAEEDLEKYRDAGINGILAKPFKEVELLRTVGDVLAQKTPSVAEQVEFSEPHTNAVVDLSSLKEMSAGDQEFYYEMLEIFIVSTQDGLEEMLEHLSKEAWEELAEIAHKMSTPCRHIGAEPLYKRMKAVESNCRKMKNLKDIAPLVKEIETLAFQTIAKVQEEISKK